MCIAAYEGDVYVDCGWCDREDCGYHPEHKELNGVQQIGQAILDSSKKEETVCWSQYTPIDELKKLATTPEEIAMVEAYVLTLRKAD